MAELTPERLAELRRMAEAATPGKWECEHGRPYARRDDHRRMSLQVGFSHKCDMFWRNEADGEYITTFDPPTALAMLDEIEQLRSENDRLISDIKMITAPIEVGGGADAYLRAEVDRLRRERETLAAALVEWMNKHFVIAEITGESLVVGVIGCEDEQFDATESARALWDIVNRLLPKTKRCTAGYWQGWVIEDALLDGERRRWVVSELIPERLAELKAPIFAAIERVITSYRFQFTRDADDGDEGYTLVDALTPPGDSDIARGKQELELLVDAVCGEIEPQLDAHAAEIEQLRAENDRLISDIRLITAPVEVGGGADAYLRAEVERLRREWEVLAAAIRTEEALFAAINSGDPDADCAGLLQSSREARQEALTLLDGQQDAHTTTYRQMDEFADGWECTAPDCTTAWSLPNGGPSHHRMRFCPGCGRRIVGEVPWRVDEDGGTS